MMASRKKASCAHSYEAWVSCCRCLNVSEEVIGHSREFDKPTERTRGEQGYQGAQTFGLSTQGTD